MLTKENRYVQPSKPKQPCLHCKTMFKAKGTKQRFCANICWLNYKHLNKIATRKRKMPIGIVWGSNRRRIASF